MSSPTASGVRGPASAPREAAAGDRRLRLDDILKLAVADGLVAAADADRVARARTQRFEHPLELVADHKLRSAKPPHGPLTLEALVEWLAGKLGVPYRHVDPLRIDVAAVTQTMSIAYAERYRILPVAVTRDTLTVATGEPFVRAWADELERILKLRVELVFANPVDIRRYLGEFFNLARSMKKAQETSKGELSLARNFEQLVELGARGSLDANDQHVVHIVDWLWQYAFDQRASDIHVEPRRDVGQVRFRIDGVLHQVYTVPIPVLNAMCSRIKLLARMEIVEKRRPQDGRIKTAAPDGKEIELRISTMPTAFGEKLVMRIFAPEVLVRDFAELGFSVEDRERWERLIREPHGILLVTGPTGSGKTTTLYSSLKQIALPEVNVCTVEDPIEMIEPAFNQMQVEPKIGVDFAHGVRGLDALVAQAHLSRLDGGRGEAARPEEARRPQPLVDAQPRRGLAAGAHRTTRAGALRGNARSGRPFALIGTCPRGASTPRSGVHPRRGWRRGRRRRGRRRTACGSARA